MTEKVKEEEVAAAESAPQETIWGHPIAWEEESRGLRLGNAIFATDPFVDEETAGLMAEISEEDISVEALMWVDSPEFHEARSELYVKVWRRGRLDQRLGTPLFASESMASKRRKGWKAAAESADPFHRWAIERELQYLAKWQADSSSDEPFEVFGVGRDKRWLPSKAEGGSPVVIPDTVPMSTLEKVQKVIALWGEIPVGIGEVSPVLARRVERDFRATLRRLQRYTKEVEKKQG